MKETMEETVEQTAKPVILLYTLNIINSVWQEMFMLIHPVKHLLV